MYYYREMRELIEKYGSRYSDKPRTAMIRMIFWNLLYIFKGSKDSGSGVRGRWNAEWMEKEYASMMQKYSMLYGDAVNYLHSRLLEKEKEQYMLKIRWNKQVIPDGEAVHIVFITDNAYAFPTSIAISSITYHCNPAVDYRIHVIGVDLEDEMKQMLIKSGKRVDCIETSECQCDVDFTHEHVSKAALFKFKIADLFPDYDKILYLDSDMIVLNDLSELYWTDIEGKYGAAVTDYHIAKKGYRGLSQIKTKHYFNSGMLLMNLEEMRKHYLPEKLLSKKKEISKNTVFSFMDQDTFNIICGDKMLLLSVKYNFLNCYYEEMERYEMHKLTGIDFEEICRIYERPTVLHIGGKYKPWKGILGEKRLLYDKYMLINRLYREI